MNPEDLLQAAADYGIPQSVATKRFEEAVAAQQEPEKTPEESLAEAERLRQEGNEKFKADELQAAIVAYEKAIAAVGRAALAGRENERVEGACECEDSLFTRAQALSVPVRLNLALCCLRLDPPEAWRALEYCEQVLSEDPDNLKATYRKAKALIELDELPEAEYELVRAVKLAPSDKQCREDLDKLRKRMRDDKQKEKDTFNGLFEKSPGFASNDRSSDAAKTDEKSLSHQYEYFRDPADNPFTKEVHPESQVKDLLSRGRMEEAVWALEAAVQKGGDASPHWLALGRLFMDFNVDSIALRCLNRAAGLAATAGGIGGEAADAAPVGPATRCAALLLRAVCLLNEAGDNVLDEVSAALVLWLDVVDAPAAEGGVEERLGAWRRGGAVAAGLTADAAVAQGLLDLLQGREEAPRVFADAVAAPASSSSVSCFGAAERLATRWNMLGAVLSSRRRYEHALAAYDQALALQSNYPRALVNRGIAFQGLFNNTGAAGAWTQALVLLPDWASLLTWAQLAKAVEDNPAMSDAAQERSLPRLQQLLGADAETPSRNAEEVEVVLRRIQLD